MYFISPKTTRCLCNIGHVVNIKTGLNSAELLTVLFCVYFLTYLEPGNKSSARQECKKHYASTTNYADVAQGLGLDTVES